MIAYLRGTLLLCREDYLVIDVNGVGYRVFIPDSVLRGMPRKGDEISLHIYTAVREDAILLYGFQTESELELYKHLISVSGVGPKVAIGVLSTLPVNDFKKAIIYEDVVTLKKIPGIGEKTAKRLILELKSKLNTLDLPATREDVTETSPVVAEAIDALMALGYSRLEACGAVEQSQERDNLQRLITAGLKYLGQR